jgi:hypothetical protein
MRFYALACAGPDLSEWACLGVGYFMLAWAAFMGIWALASWRLLWQARRRLDRAGGLFNGRGWGQIPAIGGFFIASAMAADVWHHIAASMGALLLATRRVLAATVNHPGLCAVASIGPHLLPSVALRF